MWPIGLLLHLYCFTRNSQNIWEILQDYSNLEEFNIKKNSKEIQELVFGWSIWPMGLWFIHVCTSCCQNSKNIDSLSHYRIFLYNDWIHTHAFIKKFYIRYLEIFTDTWMYNFLFVFCSVSYFRVFSPSFHIRSLPLLTISCLKNNKTVFIMQNL